MFKKNILTKLINMIEYINLKDMKITETTQLCKSDICIRLKYGLLNLVLNKIRLQKLVSIYI